MNLEVVEEAADVGGHDLEGVGGRIVWLVAAAVTATVEPDHVVAGARQRLLPAGADPVELVVGREAMHQHDGRPVFGTVELVVQTDAVAVEVHSRR